MLRGQLKAHFGLKEKDAVLWFWFRFPDSPANLHATHWQSPECALPSRISQTGIAVLRDRV